MNVANLQIEGLLMAVASLHNSLVHKGVMTVDEIDGLLKRAEANLTSEERMFEDLSPAQRDAVCFPLRFLRLANIGASETSIQPFSEIVRNVGLTKEPYNDQM